MKSALKLLQVSPIEVSSGPREPWGHGIWGESSLTFEEFVAWLEKQPLESMYLLFKNGDFFNVMLVYRSVDFWKIEMMIQSSTY